MKNAMKSKYRMGALGVLCFLFWLCGHQHVNAQDSPWVNATLGDHEDKVVVTWSKGIGQESSYRVLRGQTNAVVGQVLSVVAHDNNPSKPNNEYVDVTGTPGVVYSYIVEAVNSNQAQVVQIGKANGSRIIFAPANVRATNQTLAGKVLVEWADRSGVEAGYYVYRKVEATGLFARVGKVGANKTFFEDINFTAITDPPVRYRYQVQAFDARDNRSEVAPDATGILGVPGIMTPPTSVLATDGQHPNKVVISWVDQDTSETGYKIWRIPSGSFTGQFNSGATGLRTWMWPVDATLTEYDPKDINETYTFDDTSADSAISYTYGVQTVGTGVQSIVISDVGQRGGLAPAINVNATDNEFDDRVEITWEQAPANTEDGFVIYRDGIEIDRVSGGPYTDQDAAAGVEHAYSVTAYTEFGSESIRVSDTGQRSVVLAPKNVNATDGDFEDRVVISWGSNATAAVMFNVYRNGERIYTASEATNEMIDYDIIAGVEYQYEVRAVAASGLESKGKMATGKRELAVPTSVQASDHFSDSGFEDRVVITWVDGSDKTDAFEVDGFRVYRKKESEALKLVADLGKQSVSFSDRTGVPGQVYTYVVRAYEGLGESPNGANSDEGNDQGSRDLKKPTNVQATKGEFETKVVVTWEDNSLVESGYAIYRFTTAIDSVLIGTTGKKKGITVTRFEDEFKNFTSVKGQEYEYKVYAIQKGSVVSNAATPGAVLPNGLADVIWQSSEFDSSEGFIDFLAPATLEASDTYLDKIVLTWEDRSALEDGYKIYRRKVAGGTKTLIKTLGADTEFYEDEGDGTGVENQDLERDSNGNLIRLTGGSHYKYWVQAFRNSGETSKQITAKGNIGQLNRPGIMTVSTKYKDRIVLEWPDRATQEWGYKVWRKEARQNDNRYALIETLPANTQVYIDDDQSLKKISTVSIGSGKYTISEVSGAWGSLDDYVITWDRIPGALEIQIWLNEQSITGTEISERIIYTSNGPNRGSFRYQGRSNRWAQNDFNVKAIIQNEYTYRVAAFADGQESEAREKTGQLGNNKASNINLREYSSVQASDGNFDSQVLVEWEDRFDHEAGFKVERDGELIAELAPNTASFIDIDAIPGKIHKYGVYKVRSEWLQNMKVEEDSRAAVADGDDFKHTVTFTWDSAPQGFDTYQVFWNDVLVSEQTGTSWDFEFHYSSRNKFNGDDKVHPFEGLYGNQKPRVEAVNPAEDISLGRDFGRRKPNGIISGRITTTEGAGVEGVKVCLEPLVSRALFFDGAGGYVDLGEVSLGLNKGTEFTLAFWINISTGGNRQTILASNKRSNNNPDFHIFVDENNKLGVKMGSVENTQGVLQPGRWYYLTLVKQGPNVTVYKDEAEWWSFQYPNRFDGASDGMTLGMWRNHNLVPKGMLNGTLDEIRIWEEPRDADQIASDRMRVLDVDEEDGLVHYWPIEDSGFQVIADLGSGEGYGEITQGVYRTTDVAPFDVCAITDASGSYIMPGVRYGSNENFTVRPEVQHPDGRVLAFTPSFRNFALSSGHPVENEVAFTENTSYTVSGTVRFAKSNLAPEAMCPVPNAQILVDGEVAGTTDGTGVYAVVVTQGVHTISVDFGDADLEPRYRRKVRAVEPEVMVTPHAADTLGLLQNHVIDVDDNKPGIDFLDITTRTLSGRVGAGIPKPIGTAVIQIRDESGCFVATMREDGDYAIQLPPQKYFLAVSGVEDIPEAFPASLRGDLFRFFDELGWREVDFAPAGRQAGETEVTSADAQNQAQRDAENASGNAGNGEVANTVSEPVLQATMDFIYRAPLKVIIAGFEAATDSKYKDYLEKKEDVSGILKGRDPVDITINIVEDYGALGVFEVEGGKLTIYDEIADIEDSPQVFEISAGMVSYTTTIGAPNITTGRVDENGDLRDYQKAFRVTAEVEGQEPVQASAWVIVLGSRLRVGTFTSYQFHEMPLFILRDPPGDGSSSSIEKGETISMTLGAAFGETFNLDIKRKVFGGTNFRTGLGIVPGPQLQNEIFYVDGGPVVGPAVEYSYTDSDELSISLSFSETFSTSSSDDMIGEDADVFIGIAPNLVFGKTDVLDIAAGVLERTESIEADLNTDEGKTRYYAYTGYHIKEIIIPSLNEILDGNVQDKQGNSLSEDEKRKIEDSKLNWERHLEMNREWKKEALRNDAENSNFEEFSSVIVVDNDRNKESTGDGELYSENDKVPYEVSTGDFSEDNLKLGARNDNDAVGKVLRRPGVNRAFSAGATVEYSETFETSKSYAWENSGAIEFSINADTGTLVNGNGVKWELTVANTFSFVISGGDTRDNGHTISYSLDDDDIGDFFSVDVVTDPVMGTPVFVNVLGTSSSPWEPWFKHIYTDNEFEDDPLNIDNLGTQRRNQVELSVSPPDRLNVPYGSPAIFTLSMANLSESGEARNYVLSAVNELNPGGAIIKVNGRTLGDIVFGMDGFESQEITLTVEKGPVRSDYTYNVLDDGTVVDNRLAVIAYAPGEDTEMPGMSETVYLAASFEVPCSEVTMVRPRDGFLFNQTEQVSGERDLIEIALLDFNLEISREDSLEFVGTEFKLQGSEAFWFLLNQVSRKDLLEQIKPNAASLDWDVTDLPDGVYELRAFAQCSNGAKGYSEVALIHIDRSRPQVFGTPQPSDGILSFGEDISITFNETIRCEPDTLQDEDRVNDPIVDRVLLHIYDPSAEDGLGERIAVDVVCDGETLMINPKPTNAQDLEGKQLVAEVRDLRDVAGNTIEEPTSWIFGVRQSAFTWRQALVTASVDAGMSTTFDAEIVNGSSEAVYFSIDGPDWLISSVSGISLPPGETQTIQFAVKSGLKDGVYKNEPIRAVKDDGTSADLDMKLIVIPDWQVNPGNFEHSMTVIAKVEVPDDSNDGVGVAADPNDQLAVFVGNELRGVASIQKVALPGGDQFLAFVTAYSNQTEGEFLRFKVWDDSEGIPYETNVKPLPFVANTLHGDPRGPMAVLAVTDLNDLPIVQEIVLNAGWTWFSTLVSDLPDLLDDVLVSLTPNNQYKIESKDNAVLFNGTWQGALPITPGLGYAIYTNKADTLVFEGARADFGTAIPLFNGWSWIGFTSPEPIHINDALVNLQAESGNWILGQRGFAQFVKDSTPQGGTWWGSLMALEPGEGYRLFMKEPAQASFTFGAPTNSAVVAKPVLAKSVVPKNAPAWFVNDRAYPHQMAVVAQLNVEGASSIDPTDMVGAFVGDELRGLAQPVVIPGQDAPVAFLMVHGVTADEMIQFRVFDADRSEILNVADEIGFEVDKAVGSVASPVVLNARLVRTPDFNADGTVAFADFLMFSQMFGKDQEDDGFDGRFDLDDDGSVNFPDFVVFSQAFGNPVAAKTALSSAPAVMSEPGVNERVQLSLHPKPGTKSDEVHVMVRVADAEALQGYGFRVMYDPSVLTFVSASSANPSQFATNLSPALVVNTTPGDLLLADMLNMEATGASDLVQLTFQSLDGDAGSFIEILDAMVSDRAGALNELLGVHLDDVRPIPSDFGLAQNRPNPFNPETVIDYQLPEAGDVLLVIYNVLGQEIVRLVSHHQVAGYYRTAWAGKDASGRQVSSGVYFYRLMMGDVGLTHKMVLLK